MTPPRGLGSRGRALYRSIERALPEELELDEREIAILVMAARQADDVARLEALVRQRGAMVPGSAGQPVLNPAITEARQGRVAISRLLGLLSIPDEAEQPRTEVSKRAQHAANVRWDLQARREGRRRGATEA